MHNVHELHKHTEKTVPAYDAGTACSVHELLMIID